MAPLTELGWTGAVEPGDGDTLMVVDTNVGWNKVNSLVDRTTVYRITPRDDGSAEAVLEITYQHHGNQPTSLAFMHYVSMATRTPIWRNAAISTIFGFTFRRALACWLPKELNQNSVNISPGENGTSILAATWYCRLGNRASSA